MMRLRPLGKSGLHVSEVGLGCEHLQGQPLSVIQPVIDAALEGGINILDVFMSEPEVRTNLGIALMGKREQVLLQGHIGAAWENGQYERSREPAVYKRHFEDFMTRLQTDYVDIGMLHFVDTQADLDKMLAGGMLDYAVKLKQQGVIRAVGVSSHDPQSALKLVQTGAIDVLMFSLNPAFDLLPPDTVLDDLFKPESYAAQETYTLAPERALLYQTCEATGVGITVMKGLGGGALLSDKASPYGAKMHVHQCMHYALTRPAVGSVLVGCRTPDEVKEAIAYEDASDVARDFTPVLSGSAKFSLSGKCMYCNHCLPCPALIDIAQVQKYLDLSLMEATVPPSIQTHYSALSAKGSDCIACGQCEPRCPFDVPVCERMALAAERLG